jgi:hypothetical protein
MATSTKTISASTDPTLATKLVNDAIAEANQEVAQEVEPSIELPPDTSVTLPGGLLDPVLGVISTAEVRELNGADEEAIAKVSDIPKSLLVILERGTVKLGDEPAKKADLDALLAGDRETLILAIRKVTFGAEIKLGPGNCPECGEEQTFDIDLNKDVPIKELEENERSFTLDCKVGKVEVSLPDGGVQKELVNSTNKTAAELDTILLNGCVTAINGLPVMSVQQIRNLSIKDRRDILDAISSRNPGPQLNEIKKNCKACGLEVPLPLTLADLF